MSHTAVPAFPGLDFKRSGRSLTDQLHQSFHQLMLVNVSNTMLCLHFLVLQQKRIAPKPDGWIRVFGAFVMKCCEVSVLTGESGIPEFRPRREAAVVKSVTHPSGRILLQHVEQK